MNFNILTASAFIFTLGLNNAYSEPRPCTDLDPFLNIISGKITIKTKNEFNNPIRTIIAGSQLLPSDTELPLAAKRVVLINFKDEKEEIENTFYIGKAFTQSHYDEQAKLCGQKIYEFRHDLLQHELHDENDALVGTITTIPAEINNIGKDFGLTAKIPTIGDYKKAMGQMQPSFSLSRKKLTPVAELSDLLCGDDVKAEVRKPKTALD